MEARQTSSLSAWVRVRLCLTIPPADMTRIIQPPRFIPTYCRAGMFKFRSDGSAADFEPVRVGTCSIVLDNTTRRYDPYNTASPLYPNVLPGRYVQIPIGWKRGRLRACPRGYVFDCA